MSNTVDWEWKHNRDMQDVASRLRDLQNQVKNNLEEAMETVVLRIMSHARREVNVKTGRLRANINTEVEKIAENVVNGYVGSNTEYALWHEVDYPYLRPALEENKDFIRTTFEGAIDDAIKATS